MASRRLDLADDLFGRLPEVGDALRSGWLDEPKAQRFCEWTRDLADDHARHVCLELLPEAPELPVGELIRRIEETAAALDPEWAKRRQKRAEKNARVILSPNPSGTATLSICDVNAVDGLSMRDRVDALAAAVRGLGVLIPVGALRAAVAARLLDGSVAGLDDRQVALRLAAEYRDPRPPGPTTARGRPTTRGPTIPAPTIPDPDDSGPDDSGPDDSEPDDGPGSPDDGPGRLRPRRPRPRRCGSDRRRRTGAGRPRPPGPSRARPPADARRARARPGTRPERDLGASPAALDGPRARPAPGHGPRLRHRARRRRPHDAPTPSPRRVAGGAHRRRRPPPARSARPPTTPPPRPVHSAPGTSRAPPSSSSRSRRRCWPP